MLKAKKLKGEIRQRAFGYEDEDEVLKLVDNATAIQSVERGTEPRSSNGDGSQ